MKEQFADEGGTFKCERMNPFDAILRQIEDSGVEDAREGITRQMSQRIQIEVERLQAGEAAERERLQFDHGAVDQR